MNEDSAMKRADRPRLWKIAVLGRPELVGLRVAHYMTLAGTEGQGLIELRVPISDAEAGSERNGQLARILLENRFRSRGGSESVGRGVRAARAV